MPWYQTEIANDGFSGGILDRLQSQRLKRTFKLKIFLSIIGGSALIFLGSIFVYLSSYYASKSRMS